MSEFNSAELANGKSIGLNGEIRGFNADVEARLADVLMQVGRWVERESGALMGHIKMAVTNGDQTVTMNLTDIDEGVLFHGTSRTPLLCQNHDNHKSIRSRQMDQKDLC